jgi:hypothetical protein
MNFPACALCAPCAPRAKGDRIRWGNAVAGLLQNWASRKVRVPLRPSILGCRLRVLTPRPGPVEPLGVAQACSEKKINILTMSQKGTRLFPWFGAKAPQPPRNPEAEMFRKTIIRMNAAPATPYRPPAESSPPPACVLAPRNPHSALPWSSLIVPNKTKPMPLPPFAPRRSITKKPRHQPPPRKSYIVNRKSRTPYAVHSALRNPHSAIPRSSLIVPNKTQPMPALATSLLETQDTSHNPRARKSYIVNRKFSDGQTQSNLVQPGQTQVF